MRDVESPSVVLARTSGLVEREIGRFVLEFDS